jgi:hypothetical protein
MSSSLSEEGVPPRVDDEPCPICFRTKEELHHETTTTSTPSSEEEGATTLVSKFVYSPACGHVFCFPCIERLLLAPQPMHYFATSEQLLSSSQTTTTLGVCPICRSELSYFDLLVEGTNTPVVAANDPLDPRLLGAVFVEQGTEGVGWGSFHFPTDTGRMPYLNNNCANTCSQRKNFLKFTESRYHAATHTWEGRTKQQQGPCPVSQTSTLRVLLTFSDSFQFITRGVMIQKISTNGSTEKDDRVLNSRLLLDGTWLVRPYNSNDATSSTTTTSNKNGHGWNPRPERTIQVTRGVVHENNVWYRLQLEADENNDSCIRMVDAAKQDSTVWTAVWNNGVGVGNEETEGPSLIDVGSRLEWLQADDDTQRPVMEWIRQTAVLQQRPSSSATKTTIIPLGGNSGRVYRRINSVDRCDTIVCTTNSAAASAVYHSNTVWGNTFCQSNKVGLASYHFVQPPSVGDTDGVVYISYEHADVAQWPHLDNGMPIPARVQFRNISFPDPRTFCGHICWLQDYGTSWQGMVRWEYTMKFDTNFLCIVSGAVNSVMAHDDEDALHLEISRYGECLVYCNAALFDEFRRRGEALNEDDVLLDLEDEGASIMTRLLVHSMLHSARQVDGTDPVEYLG